VNYSELRRQLQASLSRVDGLFGENQQGQDSKKLPTERAGRSPSTLVFGGLSLSIRETNKQQNTISSCVMWKIQSYSAEINKGVQCTPSHLDGISQPERPSEFLPSEGLQSVTESAIQRISAPLEVDPSE